MPKRVPRMEHAATMHLELMKAVTGVDVSVDSPEEVKQQAEKAFLRVWNYDLWGGTLFGAGEFGEVRTSMGHATFAAGGVDFNDHISCPFRKPEDVLAFDPWETFGERDKKQLTRKFEWHYQLLCANYPECVNQTGIYVTLMSGLIDLFGWEMLLLAAGTDPEGFGAVANRYASWIQQYHDALAEADVPVVQSHDDIVWTAGPFIHPDWYRKYIFPNYKKFFAPLIEGGKKILWGSDGNYNEFIDDVVACGVHGLFLEPLTDMRYIAEKYGKTHVFIGNADTRVLLLGKKEDIRTEVERCMAIGKNCPGFFMAVGNQIPPNTPVENAIYYNEVYEQLSKR